MNDHPSNYTDPSSISNQLRALGSNSNSSSTISHVMSQHDDATSTSPISRETITVFLVLLLHVAYLYQWNSRRQFWESYSILEAIKHPRLWYRLVILSLFSNSSHHSWDHNPPSAMNQNQQQQQHQQRWWWLSFVLLLYQVHLIWSCRAVEGFYYPYFGLALLAWIAINQALVALVVQRWFLMSSSAAAASSSSVMTSTILLSVPRTTPTSTTTTIPATTISMLIHQGVGGGAGCTSLTITWLVVFSHLFQHVGIPAVPLDPLVALSSSSSSSLLQPPPEVSRRLSMILLTALHVLLVHDRITTSTSVAMNENSLPFKVRCCLACILQPLVGWITGKLWTLGLVDFLVEPYWGGWLCSFLLLVGLMSFRPHWEPMPGLVIWSAALNHSSKNDDDDDNNHHYFEELSNETSNAEAINSTRDLLPQRESIYGRLPEFDVLEVDTDDDDAVDYDPGNDEEEQVIRRSLLGGAVRSRRGRVDVT